MVDWSPQGGNLNWFAGVGVGAGFGVGCGLGTGTGFGGQVTVPPASTNLQPDFSAALTGPPSAGALPALRPALSPTYSIPSAPLCPAVPHGTQYADVDGATSPSRPGTHADFLKEARRLLLQRDGFAGDSRGSSSRPAQFILGNTFAVRFMWSRPAARSVFLAGDFNAWGLPVALTRRAVMGDPGRDNVWETVLRLRAGTYCYKYVVDGEWKLDVETISIETPEHGMANKLIIEPRRPA